MSFLTRVFRVGLLGLFTATAFSVSTPASALIADPIALDWVPICFDEGFLDVEKGDVGFLCVAAGDEGAAGTPAPYDTPVGFAATLTEMQHIELFPTEPIEPVEDTGPFNLTSGVIAFNYVGMEGDNIGIAGYLSDENGEEILDTSFFGSVNTTDVPEIEFDLPIQGCVDDFCTVLLLAGDEELRDFSGVTFHDIHFTVTTSMVTCDSTVVPCIEPLFRPIFAFFVNQITLLEGVLLPVGTVGDWRAVPEPTTLLLLGLGLAGLGFARKREKIN